MVVSDSHRYVFIQVPHTGCTAVGRELCEVYGNRSLLVKHANLAMLRQQFADGRYDDYRSFCGIRNPLDIWVTKFFKLKTNHRGHYTDPSLRSENGGWVNERQLERFRFAQREETTFSRFITEFPGTGNIPRRHRETPGEVDYLIRQEYLQEDFAAVLARFNIELERPVPLKNHTEAKSPDFLRYYDAAARKTAERVLAEDMDRWGYVFPWRP